MLHRLFLFLFGPLALCVSVFSLDMPHATVQRSNQASASWSPITTGAPGIETLRLVKRPVVGDNTCGFVNGVSCEFDGYGPEKLTLTISQRYRLPAELPQRYVRQTRSMVFTAVVIHSLCCVRSRPPVYQAPQYQWFAQIQPALATVRLSNAASQTFRLAIATFSSTPGLPW